MSSKAMERCGGTLNAYCYMTFWEGQNYGDSKKISGCQDCVGAGGDRNEEVKQRRGLGQ